MSKRNLKPSGEGWVQLIAGIGFIVLLIIIKYCRSYILSDHVALSNKWLYGRGSGVYSKFWPYGHVGEYGPRYFC